MEEKGRKKKNEKIKVVGDGLGTLVGVPMAPKKINLTEVTTFSDQKFVGNRTVWVPIDSY